MIEEELEDELEEEPDEPVDGDGKATEGAAELSPEVREILREALRNPRVAKAGHDRSTGAQSYAGESELGAEFYAIAYRVEYPVAYGYDVTSKENMTERGNFEVAKTVKLNATADLASGATGPDGVGYEVLHRGVPLASAPIACAYGNLLRYQMIAPDDPDDENVPSVEWSTAVSSKWEAIKDLITGPHQLVEKCREKIDENLRLKMEKTFADMAGIDEEERGSIESMRGEGPLGDFGAVWGAMGFGKGAKSLETLEDVANTYLKALDTEEYELSDQDKSLVKTFLKKTMNTVRIVQADDRWGVLAKTLLWGRLVLSPENRDKHWGGPEGMAAKWKEEWWGAVDDPAFGTNSATSRALDNAGVLGSSPYAGALGYVDVQDLGSDALGSRAGTEWRVETLGDNLTSWMAAATGEDLDPEGEDSVETGWGIWHGPVDAVLSAMQHMRVWQEYNTLLRAIAIVLQALQALQNDGRVTADELETIEKETKNASTRELGDMIEGTTVGAGLETGDVVAPTSK